VAPELRAIRTEAPRKAVPRMTAAYIRARVERDGLTEDLARIERGKRRLTPSG